MNNTPKTDEDKSAPPADTANSATSNPQREEPMNVINPKANSRQKAGNEKQSTAGLNDSQAPFHHETEDPADAKLLELEEASSKPPIIQIADLPFVEDIEMSGKHRTRCFWSVHPTGDWQADYETGSRYAQAFVEFRQEEATGFNSLCWIVKDMPRGENLTGIEAGFLGDLIAVATIGGAAVWARRDALKKLCEAEEAKAKAERSERARKASQARWAKHKKSPKKAGAAPKSEATAAPATPPATR